MGEVGLEGRRPAPAEAEVKSPPLPRMHLLDVTSIHKQAVCGIIHPPLRTDNLTDTTCKRCLTLHEKRMEDAPRYRAAVEALTQPWETRQ